MIKSAAFGALTEGLETILLLGWIPVVNDNFHRHPATPDASRAFRLVGSGVQAAMPLAAIGFQVGWHSMKQWGSRGACLSFFADLDTAHFIETGCFEPRIRDRNCQTTHYHADMKLMLFMCGLSHGNVEFTAIIPACSADAKNIPLVAVGLLIKSPHEADARLNSHIRFNLPSQFYFAPTHILWQTFYQARRQAKLWRFSIDVRFYPW
jgi:hypothetical protein